MKHNYLYDALPFLKDVEKERQEKFKEYFKDSEIMYLKNTYRNSNREEN